MSSVSLYSSSSSSSRSLPKLVSSTFSTSSSSLITYVQSPQFVRPSRRLYRPHDSSVCWSPALSHHYFSIKYPFFVTKNYSKMGVLPEVCESFGGDMIVSSPPAYPSPSWNVEWHDSSSSRDWHLLLHPLSAPCVPETFCKRIVVDLQLGHLLILICCHRYELTLLKI